MSYEYEVKSENVIEIDGESLLFTIGNAFFDSPCCGQWGSPHALVEGFIREFHSFKNSDGLWVSEVETITENITKREIEQILTEHEVCLLIGFR